LARYEISFALADEEITKYLKRFHLFQIRYHRIFRPVPVMRCNKNWVLKRDKDNRASVRTSRR
jgi:hypothetical protein